MKVKALSETTSRGKDFLQENRRNLVGMFLLSGPSQLIYLFIYLLRLYSTSAEGL